MAGICSSCAECHDRCYELDVCRTHFLVTTIVVYQPEKLRFRQYEMLHLLSVLCCYTWVEVCAHKTIGQTAVQQRRSFLRNLSKSLINRNIFLENNFRELVAAILECSYSEHLFTF